MDQLFAVAAHRDLSRRQAVDGPRRADARVLDLRRQEPVTDLATALADSASQLAGKNGPSVQMTCEGAPRVVHPLIRQEIERIADEALRNAVSHAKASKIEIILHWARRELRLAIRDDGVGVPAWILARGESTGHFGLLGIRERAERITRLVARSTKGPVPKSRSPCRRTRPISIIPGGCWSVCVSSARGVCADRAPGAQASIGDTAERVGGPVRPSGQSRAMPSARSIVRRSRYSMSCRM